MPLRDVPGTGRNLGGRRCCLRMRCGLCVRQRTLGTGSQIVGVGDTDPQWHRWRSRREETGRDGPFPPQRTRLLPKNTGGTSRPRQGRRQSIPHVVAPRAFMLTPPRPPARHDRDTAGSEVFFPCVRWGDILRAMRILSRIEHLRARSPRGRLRLPSRNAANSIFTARFAARKSFAASGASIVGAGVHPAEESEDLASHMSFGHVCGSMFARHLTAWAPVVQGHDSTGIVFLVQMSGSPAKHEAEVLT